MINRIDTLLQVDFSLNFGPSQKLVFDLENWALVAFTARSHQSLINNSNNKWARNSDYQLNMNMDQSTLGIVSIICACKNVMWIFGTKPMKCPLSFFTMIEVGKMAVEKMDWSIYIIVNVVSRVITSTLFYYFMERGSSVVECRTRNQVSTGSNPSLLPFRRLGIFVLSIDAPVHSAV